MKKNTLKNITIYVLIGVLIVAFYVMSLGTGVETAEVIDSTQLIEYVNQDKVESVTVQPDGKESYLVTGELTDKTKFTTTLPQNPQFIDSLGEKGVAVEYKQAKSPSVLASLLMSILPILLIMGFFIFMMNQSQGGAGKAMQFAKSRAKLNTDEKNKVTFKDVAGVDEVKEELAEIVEFLKEPKKFTSLGAKIPKGVLLYGPPGTGKTLLARAVAGEAGVPFFTISGSDFVEMFVGVGASRVRDMFDTAKKQAPCIVFIDEIDAVGRQRGAGLGGGHDEREQTLNQLLVEMDGFSANEGIIVIAATNRPDVLDPALLRPGRFDRQVTVNAPDVLGREQILAVHAKDKPLGEDVELGVIAKRTPGFTGADLANVLNEAALLAARRNKTVIEMQEIEDSVERVIAGPEKKTRAINDYEKRLVSYHEAGHAVVSYYLPTSDPLHKISIIPRGRAGGYTLLLPEEDRNYVTKQHILDEVVMLLGGRMSEKIILKDISTGASNDLERASDAIRSMITRYGMSDKLGYLTFGKNQEQVFLGRDISHDERNYSDQIAYEIDLEASRIMNEAYERAENILLTHIDKLHAVAKVLMEKETMEAEEFYAIMDEGEEKRKKAPTFTEDKEVQDVEIKAEENIAEEITETVNETEEVKNNDIN